MPRIDDEGKQEIKRQVWLTVLRNPNGIRTKEIAETLQLDRRRVANYLLELEYEAKIMRSGWEWFPSQFQGPRLHTFELSSEEVITLYLGARLLVKQHDKRNEPAELAFRTLARVLKSDAGIGDEIAQAADELSRRVEREGYQPIFRDVVRAYAYRKKIRIEYKPLGKKPFTTTFATYLLEPSLVGFSTYLIGHSSIVDDLREYKLERVLSVETTDQPYQIPPDFPGLELLRHAWSVVPGEELIRVVLRFSPAVTERVKETRWHESETTLPDPDKPGWLRWTAQVADTLDMLPWIRGWGADCEVLEPEGLREKLKREARHLAQLYKIELSKRTGTHYYAHSKEGVDETEWQLLKDHLKSTGDLAYELGRDAGVSELARVAGTLHDIGKYSRAFQDRLRGSRSRVDHATAGAKEVVKVFPDQPHSAFAELLSYCIAGHHSGLPDYGSMGDVAGEGTLLARREKKKLEDYSAYKTEIESKLLQFNPPRIKPARFRDNNLEHTFPGFSTSFLTRMVFSTLVDADWLETEKYMYGGVKPRGSYASIEALTQQFNHYIKRFENPKTPINRKRTETLKNCLVKSDQKPGFFTLTVPTGGGKTLASMAFALNHAHSHGLKRVIYVIPFTSIIEQNAAVFREALGPLGVENVLEHHSNFDWEQLRQTSDDETNSAYQKLKLAAENWDIPIVVTTNVQFFESLFANKKSQARKLHNIAKSVIIFDEVQMLPREYLKPCLLAIYELVQNYGVSAILSTATQPALQDFFPNDTDFTELAPDTLALFDFFRRVQVKHLGTIMDEDLLERLNAHEQALCIVNTRRHAKGIFDGLAEEGSFHLSTLMCPAHRKTILDGILQCLANGHTCRVVSTQVMEAGIDVDFPVGYRALAGLDSIIQAAGRVNREGRQSSGDMFIFDPQTEFIKRTPIFIEQTSSVAEAILRDFDGDPTTVAAIETYYKMLYSLQDERNFDTRRILGYFDKGTNTLDFDFKTAGEQFKFIDDNTVAVIIPYNKEAMRLLGDLKFTPYPLTTLRMLQIYTVNIYEREFQALQSKGVIQTIGERYHVLDESWMETYYHPQTGLILPESGGGEAVFFD